MSKCDDSKTIQATQQYKTKYSNTYIYIYTHLHSIYIFITSFEIYVRLYNQIRNGLALYPSNKKLSRNSFHKRKNIRRNIFLLIFELL